MTCEASVSIGEVESVGKATITVETEHGECFIAFEKFKVYKMRAGVECAYSSKVAMNRACEEAFSKLVLVVLEPGSRVAAVRSLSQQPSTNNIS